ncbi:hypothetical protein Cgig2_026310 [Carnegiea gigantea]|uniref:Uncharacterized protein n=1 Tax=Carnegiea gigantea TaxID=171969 RepID=A0A9Q1QH06_9CARY|nr:hypothetical protein Cgig2_026310 [Carnegiea gigantea]
MADHSHRADQRACHTGSTGGVCMMSNKWKDEHSSFINFISAFLSTNAFRLNIVPIAPVLADLSGINVGRPMFVPVLDLEMGFEKIVKIAHARGVCKQLDIVTRMKAELNQAIGSIEAIAKASKECLLENTDLSADKAETIMRFFREPKFYLSPKFD